MIGAPIIISHCTLLVDLTAEIAGNYVEPISDGEPALRSSFLAVVIS
jgi:hypothetical protein